MRVAFVVMCQCRATLGLTDPDCVFLNMADADAYVGWRRTTSAWEDYFYYVSQIELK